MRRLDTQSADFEAAFQELRGTQKHHDDPKTREAVANILAQVRAQGDAALLKLSAKFDGFQGQAADLEVPGAELEHALRSTPSKERMALERAAARIQAFHALQMKTVEGVTLNDGRGLRAELRVHPLDRVGIYVPGGTAAYPSSVLMNAIPARVAGVGEVIMVTPSVNGERPMRLVLAAAALAQVDRVFLLGGAQAVAALAYGTSTVPQVNKIVGPGNRFVAEAKRQVYGHVGIDQIAGPSEVALVADASATPEWLAADLLAQAEHDPNSSAVLFSAEAKLLDAVQTALEAQLSQAKRNKIAAEALANNGALIQTRSLDDALVWANRYAPEHLGLAVSDPDAALLKVPHAGACFLGHHTPEAIGDYNGGTNHVLPTGQTARFASPLSVHEFVRRQSVLGLSAQKLAELGPEAVQLAQAEGLYAHADAVEARRSSSKSES